MKESNLKVVKMGKYTSSNMEKELMDKLNPLIGKLGCNSNDIDTEHLICLKEVGSLADNILTVKTTEKFVENLKTDGIITDKQRDDIRIKISKTSPNANGYDVQYDGKPKIIAEVKCNTPVNADSFGAKQIEGITKDINNLFNGKESTKETKKIKDELNEYYKFFVVMICGSIEKLTREKIRDCMDKIIDPINASRNEGKILYYDDVLSKNDLTTDNVYVVFVSID